MRTEHSPSECERGIAVSARKSTEDSLQLRMLGSAGVDIITSLESDVLVTNVPWRQE